MSDKQEITRLIEECIKIEESVIPLYSKHIHNTLFLSGFDKKSAQEVSNILDKLKTDSERHRGVFENLLTEIERSSKNVY